jgi:hypothetical protein
MATEATNISLTPNTNMAMTDDDIRKVGAALQDQHFRQLLCDYASEVTNDDNVARYEAEVTQVRHSISACIQ